jgi:hypothetical protein
VDEDGYRLRVVGAGPAPIGTNDTVFVPLPRRTHLFLLEGIAPNCGVDPRPDPLIQLGWERDTVALDFQVRCWQPLPLGTPMDLTGTWYALAWEFFPDSTFTDSLEELMASGWRGTLQIDRARSAGDFTWRWRETYPAWPEEYATVILGSAKVAAQSLVGSSVHGAGSAKLECDWGSCDGPLHGHYRLRIDHDRLFVESTEATRAHLLGGTMPAWSRLTLIKIGEARVAGDNQARLP